jgi:hypothetical protein
VLFTIWGVLLMFLPELLFHHGLQRLTDAEQDRVVAHFRTARDERVLDRELRRLDREPTWLHARNVVGLGAALAQVLLPAASLLVSILIRGNG